MSEKGVSIIIPVYNAEKTLSKCIDSAVTQVVEPLEIILIDDGSTDGSGEIIDAYAARYKDKIVAIHQQNAGVSAARNAGLDIAKGHYIGFIDSDDAAMPSMYRHMTECAEKYDTQITFCARYSLMRDGRELVKLSKRLTDSMEYVDVANSEYIYEIKGAETFGRLFSGMSVFIWDKLFDGDIIRREGLRFPIGHTYGEDFCFLAKYLYYVRRVGLVDEPLYCYNAVCEGSITNSVGKSWYYIYDNLQTVIDFYKEKDAFDKLREYICDVAVRYYDRRANAMCKYGQKSFQIEFLKYSFDFLDRNFPEWKEVMLSHPEVIMPRVKTNLNLMKMYVIAPNFIERRFAAKKIMERRAASSAAASRSESPIDQP